MNYIIFYFVNFYFNTMDNKHVRKSLQHFSINLNKNNFNINITFAIFYFIKYITLTTFFFYMETLVLELSFMSRPIYLQHYFY